MTKEEKLLEQIEQLEAENRRLRERENDSAKTLGALIRKFPSPVLALGEGMEVLSANEAFVREGGYRVARRAERAPGLTGVAIDEVLPSEMCVLARAAHLAGEDTEREDMIWNGTLYAFSACHIRRGQLTIVLLRPLGGAEIPVGELTDRLQQAVDRNMRMIQQIAFLLGEEVSENAKTIGSVIRALRAAEAEEGEMR